MIIIRNFFKAILCRLQGHKAKKHYLANVLTEDGNIITIGWCDCHNCGWSKINFFYGNR